MPTQDTQSKLTWAQRERAILDRVRQEIATAANDQEDVAFAMRRYIYVRLSHDERSSPMARKKLKLRKFDPQGGICTFCNQRLEQIAHTHLQRKDQRGGYTDDNTELVHSACHTRQRASRHYL